jgi:Transglutaminase-like superfamily
MMAMSLRPRPFQVHVLGWLALPAVFLACAAPPPRFTNVERTASVPPRSLDGWPYRDQWTGIVLNGEKIGLSHLAIRPPADPQGYVELQSEAILAFHFLGFSKSVAIKARDWITPQLRLVSFSYEFELDGRSLTLHGVVENGRLTIDRTAAGRSESETLTLAEPLYPLSATALMPVFRGLAVGNQYRYLVYDGQQQRLAHVTQRIAAYQESELYAGRAFKIDTAVEGQQSTLWLDDRGVPILEMALDGKMVSTQETEQDAKMFLAVASVNKRDVLLEFSRIRSNLSVPAPRDVARTELIIRGLSGRMALPSEPWQDCGQRADETICRIQRPVAAPPAATGDVPAAVKVYLKPSQTVQSVDPETVRLAKELTAGERDPLAMIGRLVQWLQREVKQKPVDVFSSSDVLEGRKAECQGMTFLYAAFARAIGIPTRVVNGVVYSAELEGFLYHTWAESYVGGAWLPVDPTFSQVGVDATHVKLLEGERPADLLPLVDVVGKISIHVLSAQ